MAEDNDTGRRDHGLIGKLHFFVIAVLAALLFLMISAAYWVAQRWAEDTSRSVLTAYGELGTTVIQHRIDADFKRLEAILSGFVVDERLAAAFRTADIPRFEQLSREQFTRLQRDRHLSHLYFISAERKVLLRLHDSTHAGDLINRPSLLAAERTGAVATGIDLGIDGALRLRVVAPYRSPDGTLLGYVEVASELLDVLSAAMQHLTSDFFVLVKKANINQNKWLEFRQKHGQPSDWNRFGEMALSSQTAPLPTALEHWIAQQNPWRGGRHLAEIAAHGRNSGVIAIPLEDGHGKQIALVLSLKDLTQTYAASRKAFGPIVILIVVGALLILVGVHVGLRMLGNRLMRAELDRHESEHSMRFDAMTGALSRREFDRQLSRLDYQPVPGGVALLMMDLDHFKSINDTYGHLAGDQVLQKFVTIVNECIRSGDSVARFGGEEFAILMVNIDANVIAAVSERILAAVRNSPFHTGDGRTINFTVSIGIAYDPSGSLSSTNLIAHADLALYRAKQLGRDRACIDLECKRAAS